MKSATWTFLLAFCAPVAVADEPSGFQAAVALEQVLVDAIARAEKSVVAIARVRGDINRADLGDDELDGRPFAPRFVIPKPDPGNPEFVPHEYGTGVIVDRSGLIVTNYHVLGDIAKSTYWVWADGKPFKATVKGADPWFDLAVLKIDAGDLVPMPFGDAKQLKKGQIVISLGNPYAIARDGQPSAGWGIVSNLSRKAPANPDRSRTTPVGETLHHYGTLIHTDVKLNLGTSGGALLNLKGEMVGLTTSLAALEGSETAAGFAIPVDDAFQRTLEALKVGRKAEYGFLGIAPESLTLQERQQGRVGVRVGQTVDGSPAARAGLLAGDVITQVDGSAVHDAFELMRELGRLPADHEVGLVLERSDRRKTRNETLTTTVRLSKKHLASSRPEFASEPDLSWRGLRVDYSSVVARFGELASRADPEGCVIVVDVVRDSPAWHAGLRPGMFVSHVNDKRVGSPKEFFAEVADQPGALRLRLTFSSSKDAIRVVTP